MFSNYIKIGLRNLSKQRSYTIINIIGLTIGIASFLLIMIYVQSELNYDRHIKKRHSIYRAVEIQHAQGVGDQHVAITMGPLGPAMKNELPEVIDFVRIWPWGDVPIEYEGIQIKQEGVIYADPSIFNFFDIELISGMKNEVLAQPNSIVLSERTAIKLYKSPANAIGKIIKFNNEEGFVVTGIIADLAESFHLQFEFIVSFATAETNYEWIRTNWSRNSFTTYVELSQNTNVTALKKKFPTFINSHIESSVDYIPFELYLQPLSDIHLRSGHIKFQWQYKAGDIQLILIFAIVAFLILIIACINFINIAIARSINKAKEVGMRKVIGANRLNLIYQFHSESIIITLISIILSIGFVELLLPLFNILLDTNLIIDFLHNWLFNIGLVGIFIGVSLLTGLYPAYYISRFQPINVLKGSKGGKSKHSGVLTRVLVTFQFIITVTLIFLILVVNKQLKFMDNKDLGYDYENVLSVPFFDDKPRLKVDLIRSELLKNPNISDVAGAADANGASGSQGYIYTADSIPQQLMVRWCFVDPNFFDLMKIPIIEGRNFNNGYASDKQGHSIILNEAAVKEFGWDQPLDKKFQPVTEDSTVFPKVIGVVKDYHYYSLRSKIEPAVFIVEPDRYRCVVIKFRQQQDKNLIAIQAGLNSVFNGDVNLNPDVKFVESIWNDMFPSEPFDFYYLEDRLRGQYKNERNSLKIFTFFALLSILISCLGLYGLISLIVEQRTNEIGVRKVMGSSVYQIVKLLVKDFFFLIIIAGFIAIPLAYYIADNTLNTFIYRIDIPWMYFLYSLLITLIISLITISYHAIRSATANPIDAIRYE